VPENTPPFTVQKIDHLVYRVLDLDRSIAFYGEVLGCRVVKRRDDLGLIHLRAGSSMIDLVSIDGRLGLRGGDAPGAGARNVDHLCLRIEPFDEQALVRHLALHNVEPAGPVSNNFGAEGFGPSLYIHDPDGNIVELKGPPGAAASAGK
jgi:catechol 2,3-dioxygenase-like lactoylglutathione lyase family enzyme